MEPNLNITEHYWGSKEHYWGFHCAFLEFLLNVIKVLSDHYLGSHHIFLKFILNVIEDLTENDRCSYCIITYSIKREAVDDNLQLVVEFRWQ